MTDRCPMVGVLAAVDPDDPFSCVDADVIRRQLEHRLGPAAWSFRTPLPSTTPLRHAAWIQSPPSAWVADLDAVIIDQRIDIAVRERAGIIGDVVVVETSLWTGEAVLASLFLSTAEPAAIDARRRMHEHLGLDRADVVDERLALGALDLYLLAARGVIDHVRAAAIVGGSDAGSARLLAEFDRIVAQLAPVLDDGSRSTGAPADLVRQLDAERDARIVEQRQAADRIDDLLQQVERLRSQVEAATLRRALIADEPD